MPSLDAEKEAEIILAYDRLGSLRRAAEETGHVFRTVQRVVRARGAAAASLGGKADRLSDIEKLIDARVAALLAARGPVNEGPIAPQESDIWQHPAHPGVVVADTISPRTGWLSDIHFAYHSQPAIDAAFDLFDDWKITHLVLGGDQLDFHSISRHPKSPAQKHDTVQAELDALAPFRERVKAKGWKVTVLVGNHDWRVEGLAYENPGLYKLEALSIRNLCKFPDEWEIIPNQGRYRMGNLDFHHGDPKGRGGGAKHVAHWMLSKFKRNIIFGNWHRAQFYPEPDGDGIVRAGFATGHMCDPAKAATYMPVNDWTQGFATIDMDPESGLFDVRQHLVHRGKFRHAGKTYGG